MELSETNNSAYKSFTVFEDELSPVYPSNFAIVNRQNIKLAASTANPLVPSRQYLMEMDTTELFNSSFKISKSIVTTGGLIEFDPGIRFYRQHRLLLAGGPGGNNGRYSLEDCIFCLSERQQHGLQPITFLSTQQVHRCRHFYRQHQPPVAV